MPDDRFRCRVCGLLQADPPWGDDDRTPNFGICDCCGTEFGHEDCLRAGVLRKRAAWLAAGAVWFSPRGKPPGWSPETQLDRIPPAYRD